MMTRSVCWAAFLMIVLGVVAGAQTTPGTPPAAPAATTQPAGPEPRLVLTPSEFNFGEVWQGVKAEQEFTVKNVGEAPLEIAARKTCGCTMLTEPKSPVAPGQSVTFKIGYDTVRYTGPANRHVKVTTNDPTQKDVDVAVKGTVKEVISSTPAGRALRIDKDAEGNRLDKNSVETQVLKLTSNFDKPCTLRIKDGQEFEAFEVELREVAAGKDYELKITTKPPLKIGWNKANIVLETGLEVLPTLAIPVAAHVQPRVMAAPFRIVVRPSMKQPTEKTIRVDYDLRHATKITQVKPSLDAIKCELLPDEPPRAGARQATHRIRVMVPPYESIPEEGAKIEVFTDHPDPEYQRLEVPVSRGEEPTSQPSGMRRLTPEEVREKLGELRPLPTEPPKEGEKPKDENERGDS